MIRVIAQYLAKPFSIILTMYMINLCVDSADLENQHYTNSNEIESIVELVYEIVLDQPDFMPEQDEPDPEGSSLIVHLDHILPCMQIELKEPWSLIISEPAEFPDSRYLSINPFISSPPPDNIG